MKNLGSKINMLILASVIFSHLDAHALDILGRDRLQGGQGVRDGLVALYQFNPTRSGVSVPANTVADESGVGTPLDLEISNLAAINKKCDRSFYDPVTQNRVPVCYLDFTEGSANGVRSIAAAAKIGQQCKANNEMTIEIWLRNDRADELTKDGRMMPLKILTMGRGTQGTIDNKYVGSSNDANFFVGIDYNMSTQFTAASRVGARTQRNATVADGFTSANNATNMAEAGKYAIETSHSVLNSPDTPGEKILVNDRIQQLIYTYGKNGQSRLYVSGAAPGDGAFEDPFSVIPSERASKADTTVANPFSGWNDQFFLGIGNELTYTSTTAPITRSGGNITFRTENREWRGEIYLLAVYCNEHTSEDILADKAPAAKFKAYSVNPTITITPNHLLAAKIYNRVVGVKIPVTAPIISGVNDPRVTDEDYAGRGMVQILESGTADAKYRAALLAATQDGFYNVTVRDFAKRMSTRDETVNTVLNDMTATIIGVTRDNIPATQLLTGNFYYMGDPEYTAAPSNMQTDLLMSNNHYSRLEGLGYNLRKVLIKVDGQKISNGTGVVDHPDPAGVLTSRAFLAAHAIAGTNRRIIEYAFKEFLCIPMTGWADSTGPENMIGQDVDRFPGGDHQKFLTSCRGCHSNMDGLRTAFAKFNFNNNFVKHTGVIGSTALTEDAETATTMCRDGNGIVCKMNRNNDVFDGGFEVQNENWTNNAYRGGNSTFFGWTQEIQGSGARQFGQMLVGSKAFSSCMVKRAFRAACKREPAAADQGMIDRVAGEFKNDNYNLKNLFSRVVITRECLGD